MFFKLIDNQTVEKAPRPLKIEGKDVFTTSEEIHNGQGFYRVEASDYPEDDKNYKPIYEMGDNVILQTWEEVVIVEDEIYIEDGTMLPEPEAI